MIHTALHFPPVRSALRVRILFAACTAALLVFAPSPTPSARAAQGQADADESQTPSRDQPVSMNERGTLNLHVADMPLSAALELLSIVGQRNIIASPQARGTVNANLYDVTFEEALEAILIPNDAAFRTSGKFYYVYSRAELELLTAAGAKRPATRVFRLNYITAADAKNYLQPILGKDGTISVSPPPATGLASEATEGGGDTNTMSDFIVVTALPTVLSQVENLLSEIDQRPRQVLVEATILRAELNDTNSLGIDFSVVGGVDFQMLGATSNAIQDLTLGQLPEPRLDNLTGAAATDFRSDVPDGGLSIGIIKNNVSMFLRALEQVTDTTVLANPKVLALNKQKGRVIVGRRDGYLTTTVTETQAVQTVQFLETGTKLIFRPFIYNDGWVRVELHPADSVGFISAQGLPSEQTTEVTTNVMVRDKETILIGGLFREVTTDTRSQIPGLGNVPLIGPLFRSKSDGTVREEVIILLTIHIVKDQDAYALESRQMHEDMERLRVGARQGLMWHGRSRLAQSHYQRAVDAMREGDCCKALWHADFSLYNNPRFLPAIELKERILREREWEHDATVGRSFIYRLINRELGDNSPGFGRPPDPIADEPGP